MILTMTFLNLFPSLACMQERVDKTYKNSAEWDRMSIMMTAGEHREQQQQQQQQQLL
jgi:hypothetical protein